MKKLITLILALTLMTATLFTFSACQPAEKCRMGAEIRRRSVHGISAGTAGRAIFPGISG